MLPKIRWTSGTTQKRKAYLFCYFLVPSFNSSTGHRPNSLAMIFSRRGAALRRHRIKLRERGEITRCSFLSLCGPCPSIQSSPHSVRCTRNNLPGAALVIRKYAKWTSNGAHRGAALPKQPWQFVSFLAVPCMVRTYSSPFLPPQFQPDTLFPEGRATLLRPSTDMTVVGDYGRSESPMTRGLSPSDEEAVKGSPPSVGNSLLPMTSLVNCEGVDNVTFPSVAVRMKNESDSQSAGGTLKE